MKLDKIIHKQDLNAFVIFDTEESRYIEFRKSKYSKNSCVWERAQDAKLAFYKATRCLFKDQDRFILMSVF